MLVTPYYNKPPQEGLFRHFTAAADASAVPVILYNVPSRTAVDLLPSTVARLARHPRIVAIKEATGSLSRAREILSACPPEFALLSGDDATAIDLMSAGRARRDFGDGQRRAAPHARGLQGRACGRFGSRRGRSTRVCSLYIRICSSRRIPYPSSGRWREWASSGTQSACRWSNCRRRITRRCCARCGPPELLLRTKLHEF